MCGLDGERVHRKDVVSEKRTHATPTEYHEHTEFCLADLGVEHACDSRKQRHASRFTRECMSKERFPDGSDSGRRSMFGKGRE